MFKLICDNREKKVLNFIKKELDKKTNYQLLKNHYLNCESQELENSDFNITINNEIVCSCIISRLDDEYEAPFIIYETDQLKTGDYIITNNNNSYPLAVIERKTLSDFSYSIKDKRHYNYEKLLKLRELTGCKIFYFIEGNIEELKYSSNIAGIKFFNLFSSFLSLQIKYDIHIIYTKNESDTARKLKMLAEKMALLFLKNEITIKVPINGGEGCESKNEGGEDNISLTELMNKSDYSEEEKMKRNLYFMWEVIPQIGLETAKKLSQDFMIKDYILGNIDPEKLTNLKPKQIINLTKKPTPKQCEAILACVPGISKTKAAKILETTSLENIIINFIDNKNNKDLGIKGLGIKDLGIKGLGKKTLENINKYMTLIIT